MKAILFNLGPSTGLNARQLTITRMHLAGDDVTPAAAHDADAGAVTTVSVTLADGTIFQAVLVDTLTSGEIKSNQTIQFQTGTLSHLGARASQPDGSEFYILAMEDLSSSSSVSSSSQSSSISSSVSSLSSISSSASSISSSSASSISSSSASSVSSSVSSASSVSASSASSVSSSVSSSSQP